MRRDQVQSDLYNFRNKEGHLIILYCDDERISLDAAKLLVQRGTDNIFLLTGGLFEFALDYSNLVEGNITIPPHVTASRTGKNKNYILLEIILMFSLFVSIYFYSKLHGCNHIGSALSSLSHAESKGSSRAGTSRAGSVHSGVGSLNSKNLIGARLGAPSTARTSLSRREEQSESGMSVISGKSFSNILSSSCF